MAGCIGIISLLENNTDWVSEGLKLITGKLYAVVYSCERSVMLVLACLLLCKGWSDQQMHVWKNNLCK